MRPMSDILHLNEKLKRHMSAKMKAHCWFEQKESFFSINSTRKVHCQLRIFFFILLHRSFFSHRTATIRNFINFLYKFQNADNERKY